jgi:large subunit ribosomal protein L19
MSSIIDSLESRALRTGLPSFDAGDRVRVHFQVIEGTRRRTQVFEGIVLRRQGSGARETFTVRKQSFGVGVERTFPLHSPKIETLEVASRGAVRRAKLYYLRGRVGKAARVAERRWGIDDKVLAAPVVAAGDEPVALDSEGQPQEEVADKAAVATAAETEADDAALDETPEAEAEEAAPEDSDGGSDAEASEDAEGDEPKAEEGS